MTLSGRSGRFKLMCEFNPFAQKEFLVKLEDSFYVKRVVGIHTRKGARKGIIELCCSEKAEQEVVDRIDYIYGKYIHSGL